MTEDQKQKPWVYIKPLHTNQVATVVDCDGFTIADIHTPNANAADVADLMCREHNKRIEQ